MPVVASSRTVTTSHTTGTATVHVISLHGLAGAIFWLTIISLITFVIGFATVGWADPNTGLWQVCGCSPHRSNNASIVATQVFITLALAALIIAFILIVLYMFVHSVSKNQTILGAVVCFFLCVVFSLIGFIVWGAHYSGLGFSYILTVIASVLCLVAGILATVQMRGGQC